MMLLPASVVYRICLRYRYRSGFQWQQAHRLLSCGNHNRIESVYSQWIAEGKLEQCTRQEEVVAQLVELDETAHRRSGNAGIKGLYLHGDTGCGKTMLMDLLYANTRVQSKQRHHFHGFMLDVHERLHRLRKQQDFTSIVNPLEVVAQSIAMCGALLCLDEFQVTDVADAMVLKRLFTAFFKSGVVIVATSNRSPEELYWGGLNRPLFEPFIPLLKQHCHVIDMSSMDDYRRRQRKSNDNAPSGFESRSDAGTSYFYPLADGANGKLEQKWLYVITDAGGALTTPLSIPVMMGRSILVSRACMIQPPSHISEEHKKLNYDLDRHQACFFSFPELCEQPFGAADYLALTKSFHTVFLSDIPLFNWDNRNAMRRFITLIDVFYELKVQMVCSAASTPENLLVISSHRLLDRPAHSSTAEHYRDISRDPNGVVTRVLEKGASSGRVHTTIGDGVEWSATGLTHASLAEIDPRSTEDEMFAFERTVSRLIEMHSLQ